MNDEDTGFYIPGVERGDAIARYYTRALDEEEIELLIRNSGINWGLGYQAYRDFAGYSGVLSTGSNSTAYISSNLTDTYTLTRVSQAGTAKKGTTTVQKHLSEMSKEQLRNYVKNLKDNI